MPSETLHFPNARQLSQLYANDPRNLDELDRVLSSKTITRDDWITFEGNANAVTKAIEVFKLLETAREQGMRLRGSDFHHTLRCIADNRADELRAIFENPLVIKLKQRSIIPKTLNQ